MTQERAMRNRFPTPQEMLAIERAARRARAQAATRLLAAAGRELKERIVRAATALAGKVRRTEAAPPYNSQPVSTRRNSMTTSFWKDALASLPPSVQRRYAANFEAAERFEVLLDLGIEAWGSAKHALARICQGAARAMRTTARILDGAAHRLLPAQLSP
jgi:hypothetical protein